MELNALLWLLSTAVCLTAGLFLGTGRLEPELAIERATVGLAFAASVVLTLLVLQRLWTLPANHNGRVVHAIQIAVLCLALVNTVGLYLLTYNDGIERYDLVVQKYQRVSDYAGFMLIQIPAAYLLSVLMRYVLRAQSSTLWSLAAADTDDLREKAAEGAAAAAQAALVSAPAQTMAALAKALGDGGGAQDLAESVQALAEALRVVSEKVDLRTLRRLYDALAQE